MLYVNSRQFYSFKERNTTTKQTFAKSCVYLFLRILERFSKHDATSKATSKWRENGVATSIYGNMTPFSRHL